MGIRVLSSWYRHEHCYFVRHAVAVIIVIIKFGIKSDSFVGNIFGIHHRYTVIRVLSCPLLHMIVYHAIG